MLKRLLILSFLLLQIQNSFGTHIRGGYISARRISAAYNEYEFILTIFRDIGSGTRNFENDLYPDKNSTDKITAPNLPTIIVIPEKKTEIWQYKFRYTYRSPGVYTAYHYQVNRNLSVLNMENSGNTTFYVETKVIIDPFLDPDQTPVITKAAVDFAAIGSVYRYNPAVYDPDGDSISYKLVPSRQFLQGQEISAEVTNYKDPALRSEGLDTSNTVPAWLTLNEKTGDLIWNSPRVVGEFNTAIKIIQWRKLRANRPKRDSLGFVLLDIQIIVRDSRNNRPILKLPRDTCVVAGNLIKGRIFATDPDPSDQVNISMYGELDTILPLSKRAKFYFKPNLSKPYFGDFEWFTNCSHVRKMPYFAVFQAEDVPVFPPPLVDVRSWRITIVGPAPKLKNVSPDGNGKLRLVWQKYICSNAIKIFIYRKIDSSDIRLDTCQPGMPAGNGFVKIAEVSGSDTTFLDDNLGKGLKRGPNYCYRIVAIFPEPAGGESLVSNELCSPLGLTIPLMVNVDVVKTGVSDGQILVRWTRPFNIDTNAYKPPFEVQILRATGNEVAVLAKSTTNLEDTILTDSGLDTKNKIYTYQLKFVFGTLQNLKDSAEKASSVRLELSPGFQKITLKWSAATPWTNDGYDHYIYRNVNGQFVVIDSAAGFGGSYQYTDAGTYENMPLKDSVEYCYFVSTKGTYSNPLIATPIINRSQISCANPYDTIKPCPPTTFRLDTVDCQKCKSAPDCRNCSFINQSEFSRTLIWQQISKLECGSDIGHYNIYYSEHIDEPLRLIGTVRDTTFVHSSLTTLAGCYAITSVDRSGNESAISNRSCVDNCIVFDLPNTIIPNRDGFNEAFTPSCVSKAFFKDVHFTVYNRWGKLIFEDAVPPEINWSGLNESNTTRVVPGIYFYLAKIKAKRLRKEDEEMTFKGWLFIK